MRIHRLCKTINDQSAYFCFSLMKLIFSLLCFYCLFLFTWGCSSKAERRAQELNSAALSSDFSFRQLSPEERTKYGNEAMIYYETHLKKSSFNGSILVAKNGQVVFEDYTGFANFKTHDSINANTTFHLASISKTFTGTEVLRLWEQKRLSLNDTLQQYFPDFPYHGVTIRMLLSHRSGLPNYLNFLDKGWNRKQKATNQDVLDYMIANKPPPDAPPGKVFHYCNTNFMLLSMIVEKITHQPFPQFMKDSVFTPLGMNNTYIFSIADTLQYIPTYVGNRPYEMDYLDCTYGDKNVYSTVRDLLQWDKALYLHTFVGKTTLDTAFTPQSYERKSMHNYGLGWRLFTNGLDSFVYHNGKWHGSNTVFTRLIQDTATIIVLGNKFNRNIYDAKNMSVIFTGVKDTTSLKE